MKAILESDSDEAKKDIGTLLALGYRVTRPNIYQVKIGPINYYPGRKTITIDPCKRHTEKGFEALLRVLDAHVPLGFKVTYP